jgi:hypothetical protein
MVDASDPLSKGVHFLAYLVRHAANLAKPEPRLLHIVDELVDPTGQPKHSASLEYIAELASVLVVVSEQSLRSKFPEGGTDSSLYWQYIDEMTEAVCAQSNQPLVDRSGDVYCKYYALSGPVELGTEVMIKNQVDKADQMEQIADLLWQHRHLISQIEGTS